MKNFKFLLFLPAVALPFALSSCKILPEPVADATRYYVMSDSSTDTTTSTAPASAPAIGLGATDLPGYLRNQRSLVVRLGENEIRYQDDARWAEPIDTTVNRIVRSRLLASGAVSRVDQAPFPAHLEHRANVKIRITRCEGFRPANGPARALLEAEVELADANATVIRRLTLKAPPLDWNGQDYAALARHLGTSAQWLGDTLAKELGSL